ncbi:MAG: hypothetical protein ACPHN3_04785 [Spongiibacter sp.]
MSDEHDKNALDGEMMNGEHQGTGLVIPDSVLPSTLYLLPALKLRSLGSFACAP